VTSTTRLLISAAAGLTLASCAVRSPNNPPPSTLNLAREQAFINLQAGWRIRAITPITKSGTFRVTTESVQANGSELSLKTSKDFVGYEVSYYAVEDQHEDRIRIRFVSAEVTKNGTKTRQQRPLVSLFQLPDDARFVRLLFLTRVSSADHDQGILAAPTMQRLEALTAEVQDDPEHNCAANPQSFCTWIPIGISVQPEARDPRHKKQWVPAT